MSHIYVVKASTQFKPFMEKTKMLYRTKDGEKESSLDQKLQYLERLFEAVEKEQSNLMTYLSNEAKNKEGKDVYEEFIENINNAESNIRIGYEHLRAQKYEEAQNRYNSSLDLISTYIEHTKLFHPLMIEIRIKKSQVLYEMDNFDDCLAETSYLLEQGRLGESTPMITITVLKLHSKVLMKLGKNDEAKESLGKLTVLCPGDDEVTTLLNNLKL